MSLKNIVNIKNRQHIENSRQALLKGAPKCPELWADIEGSLAEPSHSNKISYWKKFSLAMAASFACLFIFQQMSVMKQSEQINLLIKENQKLQARLTNQNTMVDELRYVNYQQELNQLDIELQKIYLVASSEKEKLALWQQRQQLLNKIVNSKI